MLRRVLLGVAVLSVLASAANAAPLFYLSQAADAASATAGLLDKQGVNVGDTGTISIIADSDVRLSGVSLNVISTGNAIKLTGPLTVLNPMVSGGARWFAEDTPQSITDTKISHIGGAALAGFSGQGIGGDSPQGAKVVLATFGYQALANGVANLQLQIGDNGVADYATGAFPTVSFGTQSGSGVSGNPLPTPGSGAAGSITVGVPEPATFALIGLAFVGGLGLRRRK